MCDKRSKCALLNWWSLILGNSLQHNSISKNYSNNIASVKHWEQDVESMVKLISIQTMQKKLTFHLYSWPFPRLVRCLRFKLGPFTLEIIETVILGLTCQLFKIVADTVGFHVAERPAYILLDDVGNVYHVIYQTFSLEYFSELQITTMVWNTKHYYQNKKVIFKTVPESTCIQIEAIKNNLSTHVKIFYFPHRLLIIDGFHIVFCEILNYFATDSPVSYTLFFI